MFEIKKIENNKLINLSSKRNFSEETVTLHAPFSEASNYQQIMNAIEDPVWYWNIEDSFITFSSKWKEITGYEETRLHINNGKWMSIIHQDDHHIIRDYLYQFQQRQVRPLTSEFRIKLKDETCKWFSCHSIAAYDTQDQLVSIAGTLKDISYQKSMEEQLRYLHDYDPVTKLHSYTYALDILASYLKFSKKGTVLFIDINGFRKIKSTYGILVGDELLRVIGRLLNERSRENDLISRIDEDKFIILMSDSTDKQKSAKVARRILNVLNTPFSIFDQDLYVNVSIGIVFLPGDIKDVFDLIKHGNSAIYAARESSSEKMEFFSEHSKARYPQRFNIENDLRRASEKNEFSLYYQPIVKTTGKLAGVEALIRWKHPKRGLVYPTDFIHIAETSGMIASIGNWVLNTACLQNKVWQDKGYPKIRTAVNISAKQLQEPDFFNTVKTALNISGLNPEYLELELTESVLVESMNKAAKTLERLKEMGVKIALDDFGNGYSSLNYLKSLPIDKIKIDRSFIKDINKNAKIEAIISAMITLSQKMNLEIVAEGVEEADQLNFLDQMGCHLIQGYIYSKPLPLEDIEPIVKHSEIILSGNSYNYYQI
ncbi:putative bifunctional diguanylate cyclase/phosphodiesterase [Clostridium aminobutyricum]|uniref:GGDEF and EAL domain-containing protein n=1 Tax=Clostridium aminobutyricum TaxID=33953 RepID=A0A939DAW4_CLOAM|nr:GGDEF and EAL domain-containing protein [Clostridium aminobutyricum]MBN7774320.1 GGDEF and EAL domain-containing protein [Clostridium aminobutyricum]